MDAIVVAGGLGTRLRSVVSDVPKVMAPINGRPFLTYLLDHLASNRFSRVVLATGYKSEIISGYFGAHYRDMNILYSNETRPLGTGGAIRQAIEMCRSDCIYVFNGDTYLDLDINRLFTRVSVSSCPIIVATNVDDTSRYGRLCVKGDKIIKILEKGSPGKGLINAGCYVLKSSDLNHFKIGQPFSIENDFFVKLVEKSPVEMHVDDGLFIDIGIPSDYELARSLL